MPQVEVTFDIDANGIVNVQAKDKATGKEQQIRIQASGGLSDSDIQRMVKEAELHSADDKRRREKVEARNQADAMVHSTEKDSKEYGDKISAADKQAIEHAVADLKSVLDGEEFLGDPVEDRGPGSGADEAGRGDVPRIAERVGRGERQCGRSRSAGREGGGR